MFLKKKKKKVVIYIQKEKKSEILPTWVWTRLSSFFLYIKLIHSQKQKKKVVIYILSKRKEKKEQRSELC
jgi:hypothetical protein